MSGQAHLYEVSLAGEFFHNDLKAIMNRLTLHTESSQALHSREIVFEPLHGGGIPDQSGIVFLRAKKDLLCDDGWSLFSYLKPESVRVHPEATVRPWATVQVTGDALGFASALGFIRRSQIYKRGYTFRRGPLIIQMFQQEQVDPKTQEPIPAQAGTLWEVEVKTAVPIENTQEVPLQRSIDLVLEVQLFMKGLLDLRRQDI
ncbi:hypothetical protein FISHEDRAFT_53580 [Fistulina hepatica ATCC 64428]|nr:hypothetical protein FISHEDRAFT_53580 [Fistulina hepatica ATCC 64428]